MSVTTVVGIVGESTKYGPTQCAEIRVLSLEFPEEAFKMRGGADGKLWPHVV